MGARPKLLASALALTVLLTGCSLIPSSWNPFGTALTRAESAEKKQEQAADKVLGAVQEEVHKFNYAIDRAVAGNPHALQVAQQHGRTAQSLVDQALGQPVLASESKWRELIERQTSLDEKIRAIASEENARRVAQLSKLSADLLAKDKALEAANDKALAYANELQGFKNTVLKVAWVVGGLFALYFLGQLLQLLANFNPAFGTAANVVNAVVSPALHAGFHKARQAAKAVVS